MSRSLENMDGSKKIKDGNEIKAKIRRKNGAAGI